MVIIQNFITLCKYFINNSIGFLVFEHIDEDDDDDNFMCNCNLCYVTGNIILFATRRLKYAKV